MGLVYVVADEQCVLVFGCSRHTDSSYRFGFFLLTPLPVYRGANDSKSRSLQYRTRYGRGRGAAARAGRTRRADRTPCRVRRRGLEVPIPDHVPRARSFHAIRQSSTIRDLTSCHPIASA